MKTLSLHSISALVVASLFAFGIIFGHRTELPLELMFAIAAAMLLVAIALLFLANKDSRFRPFLTISLILLILCAGAVKIRLDMSSSPDVQFQSNRMVEVVGKIIEPPSTVGNRTRFTLNAESITDSSGAHRLSTNILVTVVRRKKDTASVSFPYGSKILLKGQLARPSAERNPGGFDARKYYEAQGIAFVMRVRGYSNVQVLDSTSTRSAYEWAMKRVVVPVRGYILSLIDKTISGEEGELLKGIYIGERSGIPYATRTAFTNSGISHILAVSGSNVVVGLAFFTMLFSLMRIPRK